MLEVIYILGIIIIIILKLLFKLKVVPLVIGSILAIVSFSMPKKLFMKKSSFFLPISFFLIFIQIGKGMHLVSLDLIMLILLYLGLYRLNKPYKELGYILTTVMFIFLFLSFKLAIPIILLSILLYRTSKYELKTYVIYLVLGTASFYLLSYPSIIMLFSIYHLSLCFKLDILSLPLFILALILLICGCFTYKISSVLSESMEPLIKRGDLILIEKGKSFKKGDILYFKKDKLYIIHRVLEEKHLYDGNFYITKGDNNKKRDSFKVAKGDAIGKVILNIKYLGYPSYALSKLRRGHV